jgi:hypothetical protein
MIQPQKHFFGFEALNVVVERLYEERPAIIVTCAANSALVSEAGKNLSRALRTPESLIEFYDPSGITALLEAISRLVLDLDVTALGADYGANPRSRILMINAAEDLSNDEVDALLRLIGGLKGIPFYVLLLAHTPDGLAGEPTLRRLQQKAFFWQVDGEWNSSKQVHIGSTDAPSAASDETSDSLLEDHSSQDDAKITTKKFALVAMILITLLFVGGGGWLWQQHRSEMIEWYAKLIAPPPPKVLPALPVDAASQAKQQISGATGQGSYVLSCGQYHDQAQLDVVDAKVKKLSPTRRVTHDGIIELFAGGYASIDEAQKAITALLPIGPCRTEIRTLDTAAQSAVTADENSRSPADQKNGQHSDQGGKTHE